MVRNRVPFCTLNETSPPSPILRRKLTQGARDHACRCQCYYNWRLRLPKDVAEHYTRGFASPACVSRCYEVILPTYAYTWDSYSLISSGIPGSQWEGAGGLKGEILIILFHIIKTKNSVPTDG